MSNRSSNRATSDTLAECQVFYKNVTEVRTPPHLRLLLFVLVTLAAVIVFALAILYDGPWHVTVATLAVTLSFHLGLWPPHGQENEEDQKGPPEPGPTLPRT